jgi:hypothetical protein
VIFSFGFAGIGDSDGKYAGIADYASPAPGARIEERFLSAQADAFAGAKAEEKVGLLRSK